METNNVEMTPEVVEFTGLTKGQALIRGAFGGLIAALVIEGTKWAWSKRKSCRKPELQIVEDEEE